MEIFIYAVVLTTLTGYTTACSCAQPIPGSAYCSSDLGRSKYFIQTFVEFKDR